MVEVLLMELLTAAQSFQDSVASEHTLHPSPLGFVDVTAAPCTFFHFL